MTRLALNDVLTPLGVARPSGAPEDPLFTSVILEYRNGDGPPDVMACSPDAAHHPEAVHGLPVPMVWWEWDAGRSSPVQWFGLTDRLVHPDHASNVPTGALFASHIARLLEVLGASRHTEAALDVIRSAPPNTLAHLAHLGPRGLDVTRLVFYMSREQGMHWLNQTNWPGDSWAMSRALSRLAPPHFKVGFQIELEQGALNTYLGLESPLYRRPWMTFQQRSFAELTQALQVTPPNVRPAMERWVERARIHPMAQHEFYAKCALRGSVRELKFYCGATVPAPIPAGTNVRAQ